MTPKQSILPGSRFSHLTALEPTDSRKNGFTVWRCRCDCGREAYYPSRYLRNGWRTACGDPSCSYTADALKMKRRYEDLTGQRFGMLVVQSMAVDENTRLPGRDAHGHILWNCRCDCGNTILAPSNQLKAGYRRTCGCLSHPKLVDLTGQRFGMLTVTGYDSNRSGMHMWKCRCDCGNETVVYQNDLKRGHSTSCGCQQKLEGTRTFIDGTCVEILRSAVIRRMIPKNNSSGIRGVYKRKNRWCAQITFKGKIKFLGSFESIEEARKAREFAEEKYFVKFLKEYELKHNTENETKNKTKNEASTGVASSSAMTPSTTPVTPATPAISAIRVVPAIL